MSQVKGALKGSYSKIDDAVGATVLDAVQKNEPLLEGRVASLDPKGTGAGGGIAAGMRAVSIRVSESIRVMGLLHAGSRVDLQAVSERNGPAELRTILQNVEVLRVNSQLEPAASIAVSRSRLPPCWCRLNMPISSLSRTPGRGSASRCEIRWMKARRRRHTLGLASVFNNAPVSETSRGERAQNTAPTITPADHATELNVQVLGASAAALGQLDSRLVAPSSGMTPCA